MDWGAGITYIGNTTFKGRDVNFGIKDADRLHHISLFGKSGSGRAAFLTSMILQDVARGAGTVVLDAVGNLAELLMERLDEDARARLVYVDPSDAEYPFSWNPLEDVRALPEERGVPLLAQYFVSIYRLRPSPLTDFFAEQAFRNPQATLLSLYDTVTDIASRDTFFPPESGERSRFEEALQSSEEAVETVKRNGRYLAKDTLMRNILGQRASRFTLRSLAEGAIVIVDLSRVRMFPTRFTPSVRLFAHGARVNSVLTPTPPTLYVHDCIRAFSDRDIEWFYTEKTIAGTVSDAVFVEEDKDFREKTLARAGTVIAFSPATHDMTLIERVFFPFIGTEDFHKLDTGELAVALTIDAVRSRPFFAKVLAIPPRQNVSYHDIQVASRAKHATPRHVVDQLFIRRKADKPKDASDPGAFSSAFRSMFAKGAQGSAPAPTGALPASTAVPAVKPAPQVAVADTSKEPEEISEDELKQMLHVDKIFR